MLLGVLPGEQDHVGLTQLWIVTYGTTQFNTADFRHPPVAQDQADGRAMKYLQAVSTR
jgi:hypothetical protein